MCTVQYISPAQWHYSSSGAATKNMPIYTSSIEISSKCCLLEQEVRFAIPGYFKMPAARARSASARLKSTQGGRRAGAEAADMSEPDDANDNFGEQEVREEGDSEEDDGVGDDSDDNERVPIQQSLLRDGPAGQALVRLAQENYGGDIKAALADMRLSKSTLKTYSYEWREFTRNVFSLGGLPWSEGNQDSWLDTLVELQGQEVGFVAIYICMLSNLMVRPL